MKLKSIFLLLFILTIANVFGQVNVNPNNEIYKDIYIWENKGYINNLPPFKPYPLQFLKKLLNEVINNGTYIDAQKAKSYLLQCENKITIIMELDAYLNSNEKGGVASTMLEARGMPTEKLSIGLNGGPYATLDEGELNRSMPLFMDRGLDYNTDTSNIGPIELLSAWDSVAAYGDENFWFQTGLSRASFGPFVDDNVFLSPDAPQTGYFALTFIFDNVIFTKTFHQLVATDLAGNGEYPEKFMSTSGFKWQALPWLNLGMYDSVTFGGRFDALYLLPFTQLMYTQGVSGFADNAMIGVTGEIEFPKNINLKGILLVDDFAFNDTIKGNFDSKYKFGMDVRLNWAPEHESVKMIELGYTMLTPHMYTHYNANPGAYASPIVYDYTDPNAINYTNYTTQGESLGSGLRPNSDKISLSSNFRLPFDINLKVFANLIRNANSNDSLPDYYDGKRIIKNADGTYFVDLDGDGQRSTFDVDDDGNYSDPAGDDGEYKEPLYLGDGSINDNGHIIVDKKGSQDRWEYIWQESFPFLAQADKIFTYQTGFSLSKIFSPEASILGMEYSVIDITTTLSYTFQRHAGENTHFIGLNAKVEY